MSDHYMDIDISSEEEDRLLTGAEECDTIIAERIEYLSETTKVSEINVSKCGENVDSGPESYDDSEPMSEADDEVVTGFEGETTEGPLDLSLKTTKYVITEPQSYVDSEPMSEADDGVETGFEGKTTGRPVEALLLKTTECVITITDSEEETSSQETNSQETGSQHKSIDGMKTGPLKKKTKTKAKRDNKYVAHKLKVLNYLRTHLNPDGTINITKTAEYFQMPRTTLIGWIRNEATYRAAADNPNIKIRTTKLIKKKSQGYYPEVDRSVMERFKKDRALGLPVTLNELTGWATDAFEELRAKRTKMRSDSFKGTTGWLRRFLKRNRLSSRVATSVGQKVPENAKELAEDFLDRVQQFRDQDLTGESKILNMDEMPVYFDSPCLRTYEKKGNNTISMKTTGHHTTRFTLMLCAYNDGRKLRPAIIFRNLKKVPNVRFPTGIDVYVTDKGSVTTEIMNKWKDDVFAKRTDGIFLNRHSKRPVNAPYRTLLTMDSATPHINSDFRKSMAEKYDTKVLIIPGGLTPLIQPMDVSINKAIKASIKKSWAKWMKEKHSPEEFTKSGKLRRAGYALVAQWCYDAWRNLETDTIKKAFIKCGLGPVKDEGQLNSKLVAVMLPPEEEPVADNGEEDRSETEVPNEEEPNDGFFTDEESDCGEEFQIYDYESDD